MATLGTAFPRDYRGKHSGVAPGAVIYTTVVFEDSSERLKYVLIAHLQTDVAHCLLFNSEIHPLICRNPATRRSQLQIDNRVEKYLPKDTCYLACHKIQRIAYWSLVEVVTDDPTALKGSIAEETKARVIGAVTVSPLISPEIKAHIAVSLKPLGA